MTIRLERIHRRFGTGRRAAHRSRRGNVRAAQRAHRRRSGILGGLLRPSSGNFGWQAAFVTGLLVSPTLYALAAALPRPTIDASWGALVVAGFFVGIGTRYGSGCTSGHGVAGLSRLSLRSLVATAAFMTAGFVTVLVTRHLLAY